MKPTDVFKFVSIRGVQRAHREDTERSVIRDARVQESGAFAQLRELAGEINTPAKAMERWEALRLEPLEKLLVYYGDVIAYFHKLAAGEATPPAATPSMAEMGLDRDDAVGDLEVRGWDALYIAHATGSDAGPRVEIATSVLRLTHYIRREGTLEDPEGGLVLLTAQPAIAPQLNELLRPGTLSIEPVDDEDAEPPAEPATRVRAREIAAELDRTRGLLDRVSAPIAIAPATLEEGEAETTGPWSQQRVAATTAPHLQALLGPSLTSIEASLLDRLDIQQDTAVTVAAHALDDSLAKLSEEAQMLAGDAEFERGLVEFEQKRHLLPELDRPLPGPGAGGDIDVHGRIKPLGIGDLKVVKQKLLAYEPGEVAYIENVLTSEKRERVHRSLDRTETTVSLTEEETKESERDTQATDRFELKRETGQTIKEDMSVKAGLSVTAAYGPVVATATGDFAYATAKEQSEKTSAQFAREVVDRSVAKLQTKVTRERTTNTINEVEETNTHGFDNRKGEEHVVGVYRWVDKRYRAQVYNYGERMLLEFVVPEPAAFYRAAHTKKKVAVNATPPPELVNDLNPGVPIGAARRLEPKDIDVNTYARYAARYGAAGVEPPPPLFKTTSATLSKEGLENGVPFAMEAKDFVVPEGYALTSYEFALSMLWIFHPKFTVQIGSRVYKVVDEAHPNSKSFLKFVETKSDSNAVAASIVGKIPLSIAAYDTHAFSLNVTATCVRTEAYATWQLSTYDKIATAYQALKTAYDQKVTEANAADSGAVPGHNPALNRSVIANELKRLCVTMMTGQHFSQFGAVTEPADMPVHYPEVEVDSALRQGPIVQFFEQAFEWEQMTYIFYPYFWAKKSKWVEATTAVGDPDPSFEEFLTAGSCRVVVPVPLAYVQAVLYMLQTPAPELAEKVWLGGEPPTLESDLYVSLAEELRSKTDDLGNAKPEGEPWEFSLPTTLVWLQPDGTLPSFP